MGIDIKKLNVTTITATVKQYGDYITISDVLKMTAIDDNLVQAQKLLANQAGLTLDTITRDILNAGTNVQYGEGNVDSRANLVGGDADAGNNNYLTVRALKMAARTLKKQNAPLINGTYVGIIHPDVAFDLTDDPEWKYPHQYVDTENIYSGEIGKIANIRFVETTEAKKILNAGSVHNLISKPDKMINHLPDLMQIVIARELSAKESDLILIHTRPANATTYSIHPPEPFERYGWD